MEIFLQKLLSIQRWNYIFFWKFPLASLEVRIPRELALKAEKVSSTYGNSLEKSSSDEENNLYKEITGFTVKNF